MARHSIASLGPNAQPVDRLVSVRGVRPSPGLRVIRGAGNLLVNRVTTPLLLAGVLAAGLSHRESEAFTVVAGGTAANMRAVMATPYDTCAIDLTRTPQGSVVVSLFPHQSQQAKDLQAQLSADGNKSVSVQTPGIITVPAFGSAKSGHAYARDPLHSRATIHDAYLTDDGVIKADVGKITPGEKLDVYVSDVAVSKGQEGAATVGETYCGTFTDSSDGMLTLTEPDPYAPRQVLATLAVDDLAQYAPLGLAGPGQ